MSCCGGRRGGMGPGRGPARRGSGGSTPPSLPAGGTPGDAPPWPDLPLPYPRTGPLLRYEGRTGLTAVGGVTGHRYRFDQPGAVLPIDPRDLASLLAIPVLRRVGWEGG